MKKLIPQKLKNYYHLAKAILANFLYGFPSRKIKIIGVTGTNGKTTTVQIITKILEEAGKKVATASTINFKLSDKEWVNTTKFTTLSSFQVQKFIFQAVKAECEYLVLEISSHSLDQFRTWGIDFDTAVITNVTREHLDYHKTMEKYRQAKIKLFKKAKNAVVNLDMEKAEEFLKHNHKKVYLFSCHSEHNPENTLKVSYQPKSGRSNVKLIKAENIKLGLEESSYQINNELYSIYLPGLFNVENVLAATGVGMIYEISPEIIKKVLKDTKGVLGRMERLENNKGIEIIIDYAVTPDSLEKVYKLISEIKQKKQCHPELGSGSQEIPDQVRHDNPKIISVLGACGERDRGKRPIMGKIVSKFADYIILSNEDPYGENPVSIINEVFSGVVGYKVSGELPNYQSPITNFQTNSNDQISKNKTKFKERVNCWRILDRREAIRKALQLAKVGDIFVITGKGAEETMAIGKKRIPWNDKEVILEELEKLN